MRKTTKITGGAKKVVKKFTKDALIASKRFYSHRLILQAKLDDKKTYSIEEVDKIIELFLTKGV